MSSITIAVRNIRSFPYVNPLLAETKIRYRREDVAIVFCGRPGKLGNPFKISRTQSRDEVISKYKEWLGKVAALYYSGKQFTETGVIEEIIALKKLYEAGSFADGSIMRELILVCYCSPENCHADVIMAVIKGDIKLESILTEAEKAKAISRFNKTGSI